MVACWLLNLEQALAGLADFKCRTAVAQKVPPVLAGDKVQALQCHEHRQVQIISRGHLDRLLHIGGSPE